MTDNPSDTGKLLSSSSNDQAQYILVPIRIRHRKGQRRQKYHCWTGTETLCGTSFSPDSYTVIERSKKPRGLSICRVCSKKWKEERNATVANLPAAKQSIRGDQIPTVSAERAFKQRALQKGWVVHRPSWPDFIVETPDGQTFAVEVKSRGDDLSLYQVQTLEVLERFGLRTYVWKYTYSLAGILMPWRNRNRKQQRNYSAGGRLSIAPGPEDTETW